jgi:hypothetical protein
MGEFSMNQHTGHTITDLQDLVERYAAKKAVDEMGDKSINDVTKRANQIAAEVAKYPSAGDWFRFLNEDRPEEPDADYDRDAEDM